MKITMFLVYMCAVLLTRVEAYSEEKVIKLIRGIPVEERKDFIKYALAKGYERVEGKNEEDIPRIFSDILTFYQTHNSPSPRLYRNLGEIVCFPWGCIDINDPAVYP